MEFKPFPKIPRLSREVVITEKIDGTNASVLVAPKDGPMTIGPASCGGIGDFLIFAASRTRWIEPGNDNYGFAAWVKEHAEELIEGLGEGHHFGEWWGKGIQRGYNQIKRRFSLFNTAKWSEERPACCDVVPVLWSGIFNTDDTEMALETLKDVGSHAAPGYPYPEGIVIYHTAGNVLFKKTLEKDDVPKGKVDSIQRDPPKQAEVRIECPGGIPTRFLDPYPSHGILRYTT